MLIKKKLTLVLIFIIILTGLFGAYLTDQPQILTQPNGEILHCLASGDEFHNWLHDENGYTIIQDPETGYYVYANLISDKLVSTSYIAGQMDPAIMGLQPGLNAKPDGFERRVEEFNRILENQRKNSLKL